MHVRLVYGVGEHDAKEMREEVREFLEKQGVTLESIDVVDWSGTAEVPISSSLSNVRFKYLCRLLAAMRSSAFLPVSPDEALAFDWILLDAWLSLWPVALLGFMWWLVRLKTPALLSDANSGIAQRAGLTVFAVWAAISILLSFVLMFRSVCQTDARKRLAMVRRLILLAVRPLIYLALIVAFPWPFLMFVCLLLAVLVLGRVTPLAEFPLQTPSIWMPVLGLILGWVLIRILGVLAQIVFSSATYPLRFPLKVLSDIFLYVGDPAYRSEMKRQMLDALEPLNSTGNHVLVFGHSLGSLISVDALLHLAEIKASIILVTAGSPIRRFFHCFFPFSGTDPDAVAESLKIRASVPLQWLNLFRRKDPIGTNLSSVDNSLIADCPLQCSRGWTTAHLDYWTDPEVLQRVKLELTHPT
jgi:hypothetical protein